VPASLEDELLLLLEVLDELPPMDPSGWITVTGPGKGFNGTL
jgi:hypothetical protein